MDKEEEEVDLREINEEYKVWKKNCPFLYDLVVTHALEWPSLTVQWLKKHSKETGKDYSEHELLLGTHTSDEQQNHLLITRVKLPNEDTELDVRKYDDIKGELGAYGGAESKIETNVRLNHDGEINRARYMPQDDYVIATKTINGEVDLFYIREHESKPQQNSPAMPNLRCKGLTTEGYGLDWSPLTKGLLLSSSDDGKVAIWDTNHSKLDDDGRLAPLHLFEAHKNGCGDVKWHKFHKDIFGSAGDDNILNIWDIRSDLSKPKFTTAAHQKECQSLDFSPFQEYLLISGGNDKLIKLWDMRRLDKPLHEFHGHTNDIFKVEWSPFNQAIFGSCSADRRVIVWDISRIGMEQTPEDAEDGPPELLFVHGGHTSKVSDFSWNEKDPWVIASVSEDNIVQIWQMAENIYYEEKENGDNNKIDIDDKMLE